MESEIKNLLKTIIGQNHIRMCMDIRRDLYYTSHKAYPKPYLSHKDRIKEIVFYEKWYRCYMDGKVDDGDLFNINSKGEKNGTTMADDQ